MFPVSGAEQFIASEAIALQPMISARAPYSRLVRPGPKRLSGRNRFQSPRLRASAFNSSITGEIRCGMVSAEKPRQYSSSAGRMRSSMKRQTFSLSSRTLGVSAKSMSASFGGTQACQCIEPAGDDRRHHLPHPLEALADGHPHQESCGDALRDDRELVRAERDVPVERCEVAPRSRSVVAQDVGSLVEAVLDGDRAAVESARRRLGLVIRPVHAEQAEVA